MPPQSRNPDLRHQADVLALCGSMSSSHSSRLNSWITLTAGTLLLHLRIKTSMRTRTFTGDSKSIFFFNGRRFKELGPMDFERTTDPIEAESG